MLQIEKLNNGDNYMGNAIWIIIGMGLIYATVMAYKNYYLDKQREKLESNEDWEQTHNEEHF